MSCSLQPSYRFCAYSDNFTLVGGNVLKSNCLRAPYLVGVVLGVHCNQGCRNKQKFKNFGQLTREFVYLLLQKEGPKITKPWLRHPWFSKLCLFATVAFCYIIFPITLIDKNLIKTSLTSPKDWTSTPSSTKYLNSDSDWMKAENE